jgi:hypothetical protein
METILFYLHIAGVTWSVLFILQADKDAFKWFSCKSQTLSEIKTKKQHRMVWLGLLTAIVSGILLFWDRRFYLIGESPAFLIKMIFVLALTLNGFFIGRTIKVATTKSFENLTFGEKIPLFISGGISSISWLGAIVSAFFL